jgi:N-glycosylase/DNA lyase
MKLPSEKARRELHAAYAERRGAIRSRLEEFSQCKCSEYFYELAYCILTPQSSAINATRAVEKLRSMNFCEEEIDPEPILFQKDAYIRFHRTKARLLLDLKRGFPQIIATLSNGKAGTDLREWLVKNVKGLGYKEASHFLRNVGFSNLAILDRHILKNLKKFGAIRSLPKTLTRKKYLRIEKQFLRFAHAAGIPMDELDLLFWSMETGMIMK